MKAILLAIAIVALSGPAHAATAKTPTDLASVANLVHLSFAGALIEIVGQNSDSNMDVSLPDLRVMRVTDTSLIQTANVLCDTATVRPSGANIFCIAK